MAEYRLHCFAQSGNAYKVALMLALSRADWEPVWVNFFDGTHRGDEFKTMNEMAQVPVLEHRDVTLSQSGLMLEYLVGALRSFGWANAAEEREIKRWLLWDNYSFTSTLAPYRFVATFVQEEKRSADVLGFLGGRMKNALKVIDQRLAGRDFVATAGPSIADLSIVGYLYYGDELPFDLAEYPNLKAMTDRIKALPGWQGPYEMMPTEPIAASA
ncbi:MAG: glutathione S-transferase [Pseudomonadota bacterium]